MGEEKLESKVTTRRTKHKKRNWFLRIAIVFVSCILVFGLYMFNEIYGAAKKSYSELDRGEKSEKREEIVGMEDPVAFLILGMDGAEDEADVGRPDVTMIVTVNPDEQSAKLLSVPRDTYTYIPAIDDYDKLNHSYSLAEVQREGFGIESTIETVEELFNIPIDYYVMLDFQAFVEVVDELGGVDVDVAFDFKQNAFDGGPKTTFKKGPAHLNGEEALAYVRMRKKDPEGDRGRNKRQREVLTSLFQSSSKISNISKIDTIVDSVGEHVQMNISPPELFQFLRRYSGMPAENMETLKLEGHDEKRDFYYFIMDDGEAERVGNILRQHLNLPLITPEVEEDSHTVQDEVSHY